MLKNALVYAASLVAPDWTASFRQRRWAVQHARALRRACDARSNVGDIVDEVMASKHFRSVQKRTEIIKLLTFLQEQRPRYLCEIGALGGGTLCLLGAVATPNAQILSIDIAFTPLQLASYPAFGGRGQRISCMKADSHLPQTLAKVHAWLGRARLDFLFIDGDHSFAGVATDFDMYAPLVRAGGTIAFHDIVPDSRMRFGIATASDVGQVPAFWKGLKQSHCTALEIVEDPNQDGYGIGVVQA